MTLKLSPPPDRDARPDGALLLTLLRKLAYNAPEAQITLSHLEAQWSAERFDPDWLAKIGVEALPSTAPTTTGGALSLGVEDFKRLCQSAYCFEALGLGITVEGKPPLSLLVKSSQAWELGLGTEEPAAGVILKELGAHLG